MVVSVEVPLDVRAEKGCEYPFGKDRSQDCHGSRSDNRTADQPSQVYVAAGSNVSEVVNDTGHDEARHVVNDSGAHEDSADFGLAEVDILGCPCYDGKSGAQAGGTQCSADDEGLDWAVAKGQIEEQVAETNGGQDTRGSTADGQGKVGLEQIQSCRQAALEDDQDETNVAKIQKRLYAQGRESGNVAGGLIARRRGAYRPNHDAGCRPRAGRRRCPRLSAQ